MTTNRGLGDGAAGPYRDDVAGAFATFGHQAGRYLAIRERHRALLAEAERMPRREQARGATPRRRPDPVAVRRFVGAALVWTGERLQGARRAEPAAAALPEGAA